MADVEQDMGKTGDDAPKDKPQRKPQGEEQQSNEWSGKEQPGKDDGKPGKRKPLWPWLLGGAVVVAFVAVVLAVIFAPAPNVWTDDAYITAHYATVSPRISGQVASVEVDDNQPVSAQQLLVTIDDSITSATLITKPKT